MNKKFYLAALGATLAFAACTEEELVSVPTSVSLENREKIELEITANKSDIVSTRITSEAGEAAGVFTFKWEKDIDKLGVAMADGATLGTVNADSKVFISYPFTANTSDVSSTFSGKSSIARGLYFFHYPYHDHLGRTALDVNLPAQAYDATSETAAIDQAMKYMKMITPIVNLNQKGVEGVTYEGAQGYKLPLTFEKLYTIVRIDITAKNIEEGNTPKVEKVTLSAGAGVSAANFIQTATLNLNSLTQAANKVTDQWNGIYAFDEANFVAKRKELHNNVYNKNIYNTTATGDIVLNVKGVTLSNDSTQSLYVLVPKGNWTGVTMNILTSEGTYVKEIAALNIGATGTAAGEGADAANAALYAKRDNIQPISAPLDFNLDGTGNVILPESFDVGSETDWNNAVTFLKNHAIAYINKEITFNLNQDIAINNLPVFKLTINGNKKLTLKSDYTISAENLNQFTASGITLAMTSGKTLTLDATMSGFKAIENSGTLVVKADQTKPITNYGTMNIAADVTIANTIVNGKLNNQGNPEKTGTITVSQGKVLTAPINNVCGSINLVAGVAAAGSTPADLTTWTVGAGTTNQKNGTININAATTVTGQSVTNKGIINHTGILAADVNNSSDNKTINIKKGAIGNGVATISGSGKIVVEDILDYATVMGDNAKKYILSGTNKVTAVVNTYEEYAKANSASSNLTYITLAAGDWAYVATVADADKAKKLFTAPISTISGIEYKGGTLKLGGATALNANIDFTGAAAVVACPLNEAGQIISSAINGNITNSVALTISNGVKVNSKDGYGTTNANLSGDVTVKSGAAMFFNTATVAKNKNLIIEGDIRMSSSDATLVTNSAVFGVKSTFTNNGYIESKAGTGKNATSGKVSQPTNTASGTFKGNATAWDSL